MVRSIEGKHPNYYEATLQLRLVDQEIIDFVEKELRDTKIPISKVEEVTNGLDYYIADNQVTRAVGLHLQQRFGGELNITSSLFSRKDGKEIYRTTVLFRKTPFNKGDIVVYGGDEYLVKAMAKEITLIGVKTKKKLRFKYKDMRLLRIKSDDD